jgi:protein-disulfide isomerase
LAILTIPVSPDDHSRGPDGAPLVIVEYGDFECPFCGQAYPVVERLLQEFGEDMKLVFRHFPLSTIHPHARRAAQAAEAAGLQQRFWEMHSLLFTNQRRLDDDSLMSYAQRIGVDTERFRSDMDGEEVARLVRRHFEGGLRSGVNRTPTFFINGQRHDGDNSYEALKYDIQVALRENHQSRTN